MISPEYKAVELKAAEAAKAAFDRKMRVMPDLIPHQMLKGALYDVIRAFANAYVEPMEAALATARREALEEAAKAVEDGFSGPFDMKLRFHTVEDAAARIRALLDTKEAG